MHKFRPSNLTKQNKTSFYFNEQQLIALIEKGLSDNSLRGFLYKRSSTNSKWRLKWFLLFENLLFYFDVGQEAQSYYHQQLAKTASYHGDEHTTRSIAHYSVSSGSGCSGGGEQHQPVRRTISSLIRRSQVKSALASSIGGHDVGQQLAGAGCGIGVTSTAQQQQQQQRNDNNEHQDKGARAQRSRSAREFNDNSDEEEEEEDEGEEGAETPAEETNNSDEPSANNEDNLRLDASSRDRRSGAKLNPASAVASSSLRRHGADGSDAQLLTANHCRRASSIGFGHPSDRGQLEQSAFSGSQRGAPTEQSSEPSSVRIRPAARERLSSDPQNSWPEQQQQQQQQQQKQQQRQPRDHLDSNNNGNNRLNYSYNYNQKNDFTTATTTTTTTKGFANSSSARSSSPLAGSCATKPKQTRTENSSSISGVSIGSHSFLGHNEQTIGRSTTTTAGKTPTKISRTSSNYSSLLNRRIGVIFLEGSYCERLVDSPVIDDLQRPASMMTMASAAGSATGMAGTMGPGGCSSSSYVAGGALNTNQHQHHTTNLSHPAQWNTAVQNGASLALAAGHANQYGHSLMAHLASSCRSSVGELDVGDLIRVSDNTKSTSARLSSAKGTEADGQELLCTFTLKWKKEGSKEFQFRTETETECQTWVHAISKARYSSLLNEREQLEQKYLHLSQIIESESTAKWQYSRQCDELSTEIEKLRREICLLKRQENRSNHLRLVLLKSTALFETLLSRQQQQQQSTTTTPTTTTTTQNLQQQQQQQHVGNATRCPSSSPSAMAGERVHELRARSADCGRSTTPPNYSGFVSPLGNHGGQSQRADLLLTPPFQRAKSMEQEQAWQERAVRRACYRRCSQAPLGQQNQATALASTRSSPIQERFGRVRAPCRLGAVSFDVGALQSRAHTPAQSKLSCGVGNGSPLSSSSGHHQNHYRLINPTTTTKTTNQTRHESPPPADSSGSLINLLNQVCSGQQRQLPQSQALKGLVRSAADDKNLSFELRSVIDALNKGLLLSDCLLEVENSEELRKIKKVQSFFRGWLCRRRWKQIVQEYIKSPHAESMRKRNNLVFKMVECEEEYVEQLTLLISAFLRPLKMAASSQRPALDHDELNSIFLNSETLLFLHQIFLKGLTARMESWPTLVLGDLFNMLLPMLTIYQEYVRNHHFSLQVLAECKQREQFSSILRRLEEKPQLNGRTLETFLTYPMHQIPRYIICLHEILAHTPHNHVERKSLYEAQTKLEDLSRQMHDEVSETENIRQNLAIERMIIGGCDILLDVNQVFVRQGILLQVIDRDPHHQKGGVKSRLGCSLGGVYRLGGSYASSSGQQTVDRHLFDQDDAHQRGHTSSLFNNYFSAITGHGSETQAKELVRQCFLFTNHLLLCTRTKDGKLRLLDHIGRISLAEVTLIENPMDFIQHQEAPTSSSYQPPETNLARATVPNEDFGASCGGPASVTSSSQQLVEERMHKLGGATSAANKHQRSSITSVSGKLIPSSSASTNTTSTKYATDRCQQPDGPDSMGGSGGAQRSNRSRSLVPNFKSNNINNQQPTGTTASHNNNNHGPIVSVQSRMECDDLEVVIGVDVNESDQKETTSVPVGGGVGQWRQQAKGKEQQQQQRQVQALATLQGKLAGPERASGGSGNSSGSPLKRLGGGAAAGVVSTETVVPTPTKSSGSFRGGIASYLVSKLSNLTSLGGGGGGSPTSTPNSPATGSSRKRSVRLATNSTAPSTPMRLASILGGSSAQTMAAATTTKTTTIEAQAAATTMKMPTTDKSWPMNANNSQQPQQAQSVAAQHQQQTGSSNNNNHGGGGNCNSNQSVTIGVSFQAHQQQPPAPSSMFDQIMAAIALASKDYGGCDFILLLESNKSSSSIVAASSSSVANNNNTSSVANNAAGGGASGTGGSCSSSGGGSVCAMSLTQGHHGTGTCVALNANSNQAAAHEHHTSSSAASVPSWCCLSNSSMLIIHLVAPNLQEKAAWMSDISQCIDNVHFNDLFHGTVNDSSTSVTVNQSVRTDPRLHKDDVDIKFSRALNSCKLPQIRYASKERLFERLTDLRFLSIDFLNTFLLTYRVFTTAEDVLEALKSVHYNSDRYCNPSNLNSSQNQNRDSFSCYANSSVTNLSQNLHGSSSQIMEDKQQQACSSPKISPPMNVSGNGQDKNNNHGEQSYDKRPSPPSPSTKKPPLVPPRSPGCLIQANSSGQLDHNNNFLLTPSVGMLTQKRRSTISALTPITGSTASSLVNIAAKCSSSSREEEASLQDNRSLIDRYNSTSCQTRMNSSDRRGSHNVSNNEIDRTYSNSSNKNKDASPTLICSPSTDIRQRSASMSMQPGRGVTSLIGENSAVKNVTTTNHLTVPGRQVRASSLSHVPSPNIVGASSSASEHWRLSYKRSTTRSKQEPQGASVNNLLSPNYVPSSSPNTPIRRKSAADVDKIQLHIDTVTSPIEADKVEELAEGDRHDDVTYTRLHMQFPCVPPSTPIEGHQSDSSPGGADMNNDFDKPEAKVKFDGGLLTISDKQYKKASIKTIDNQTIQYHKEDMIQNSTASSHCSSDEENNRLRLETNSSKSESDMVRSPSSSNEDLLHGGGGGGGEHESLVPQKKVTRESILDGPDSRREIDSLSRKKQQGFIMKEIDLTQSRIIDSDTSADESEAGSSDGSSYVEVDSNDLKENAPIVKGSNNSGNKSEVSVTLSELSIMDDGRKAPKIPERDIKDIKDSRERRGDVHGPEVPNEISAKSNNIKQERQNDLSGTPLQKSNSAIPDSPNLTSNQSKNVPNSPLNQPNRKPQKPPGISSSCLTTPRSSFQYSSGENPLLNSKAGVVVTSRSPRVSSRRSSTASAASAFAVATAASSNPLLTQPPLPMRQHMMIKSPLGDISSGSTMSIDPSQCACAQLHRGSVASILPQRRDMYRSQHHPSCVHSQYATNNGANLHSDATSLCNSRASSRLSSCAGLEFSYQHQHQQQAHHQQGFGGSNPMRQHQQAFYSGAGRSSYQSSALSLGSGHFGSNRYASQANIQSKRNSTIQQNNLLQQNSVRSMATLRVLSVLRHWVSKHSQDFVNDSRLATLTQEFLQDLIADTSLLPAEHKAALQLQQMVQKAAYSRGNRIDLNVLLAPPTKPSPDSIETLSALEIAEGMTYLDHKIFLAIKSEEFLGQAWMKSDKAIKAPHILLITKRFNDVSRLVSSEIIRVPELHRRVAVIEKWTNVAHICRVIHNFNGVLQICAAFTNSSVFRLKKTWDKIPKTTKATIDQLQNLVSTDSRFRNMRDAINRCDPPSIPYVGMYLTDLSFIEEGTPNYSPEGLLNFSKMRMIAHVIREIQHLQNGVYKMDLNPRVANYLLDASRHLQDDEMYRCSLAIEHR